MQRRQNARGNARSKSHPEHSWSKHGKMVVEFADLEDLERIYRLMTEGPDLDE